MSKSREILLNPIFNDNPIALQILGICSALAVTTNLSPTLDLNNFIPKLFKNFSKDEIMIIGSLIEKEGLDFEDDPNQPYVAPDDYVEDDFGAFYTDENTLAPERGLPFDDSAREDFIRRQNEVIPAEPLPIGSPDPQGDFDSFNEYVDNESGLEVTLPLPFDDVIPPIPFDDSMREAGIASLYGQGPQWGRTDRRYEDEYRDHICLLYTSDAADE